jgi:hypothetical protein
VSALLGGGPKIKPAAILDLLLPPRSQEARDIACRDDDVNLRWREPLDGAVGLGRSGPREELVADQAVAVRNGVKLGAQALERARSAWIAPRETRTFLEVQRCPQMLAMSETREVNTFARKNRAVLPENLLQVGCACLGQADVQKDPLDHVILLESPP